MAGKNNKKGRGSGGTISSAPPKPSGMKVNQFQEASRNAQQRAGRMESRIGLKVRQAIADTNKPIPKRPLRGKALLEAKKARARQGTLTFARDQVSGRVSANAMAYAREARMRIRPTSSQYSAPATRLY